MHADKTQNAVYMKTGTANSIILFTNIIMIIIAIRRCLFDRRQNAVSI
jgi:hypothetical protein